MRLCYTEDGHFKIQVDNVFGQEVDYPPVPEYLEEIPLPKPSDGDNKPNPNLWPDNSRYLHTFNKWLTNDDIYGNTMVKFLK